MLKKAKNIFFGLFFSTVGDPLFGRLEALGFFGLPLKPNKLPGELALFAFLFFLSSKTVKTLVTETFEGKNSNVEFLQILHNSYFAIRPVILS